MNKYTRDIFRKRREKVKKLICAVLALMLAFGLTMFAGCDNTPSATIRGNYSEVTSAEDWDKVAKALDVNAIFGDMSKEDWKFGISLNGQFGYSQTIGDEKNSIDASAEYDLSLAAGENGPDVKGAGSFDFAMSASESNTDTSFPDSMQGEIYNDAQYFYINSGESDSESDMPAKMKIDYMQLLSMIMGNIPSATSDTTAPAQGLTGEQLKAMFEQLPFVLEADFSVGTKLRLSLNDEAMESLILQISGQADISAVTVEKSVLQIYLQLDENGAFKKATVNLGVIFEAPVSADSNEKVQTDLTGAVSVDTFSGTVTLPTDLDSYVDILGSM